MMVCVLANVQQMMIAKLVSSVWMANAQRNVWKVVTVVPMRNAWKVNVDPNAFLKVTVFKMNTVILRKRHVSYNVKQTLNVQ